MKTCLIVDDSAVIRKVARRILEAQAYSITEAADGKETIARCEQAMPDAILLDWSLPDQDGLDVLRAIRRLPDGKIPKIVFCMLEYDQTQVARARHLGANETILKPFDKQILLSKLRDAGVN